MSLFGALLGDFEDESFLGNPFTSLNMQMRNINRFMNNMMTPDPFNMLNTFDAGFNGNNTLIENVPMTGSGLISFPGMPSMNRLLSTDISNSGTSFCSSSIISMSSGPDGRPQIYQATSSTKTGPGGICETRKTVQDSCSGVKKMAIGHHIGERSHIIEKEQNLRSGQHEERQEFINLDEDEVESFDREFTNKAHKHNQAVEIMPGSCHHSPHHRQYQRVLPALPAPSAANARNSPLSTSATIADLSSTQAANTVKNSQSPSRLVVLRNPSLATPRRPLRTPPSSPLALSTSGHTSTRAITSVHPHPYNNAAARRIFRSKHSKQHQEQFSSDPNRHQEHKK